jgi:hypothetical protein
MPFALFFLTFPFFLGVFPQRKKNETVFPSFSLVKKCSTVFFRKRKQKKHEGTQRKSEGTQKEKSCAIKGKNFPPKVHESPCFLGFSLVFLLKGNGVPYFFLACLRTQKTV